MGSWWRIPLTRASSSLRDEPGQGPHLPIANTRWSLARCHVKLLLFRFARLVLLPLLRLLLGLHIEGLEHVPAKGPALMVANHLHNADPVLLMAAFPRPIRFMAKKELFGVPVIGWFVRQVGAFPVDRSSPVHEVRTLHQAEQLLTNGMIVGIFAEGTRSVTGGLQEAHPGVAMLALHSGAPILPTAIFGTEVLPFNGQKGRHRGKGRPRVTVCIGPPFHLRPIAAPHRHREFVERTDVIMVEIAQLLPPQYRGIYAERAGAANPSQAESPAGIPDPSS